MKFLFPLIFIIFFTLVHYLAYSRVVKRLILKEKSKKFFLALIALNMLGILGYLIARYVVNIPNSLYFLLSIAVGVGFIIFIGTLLYEIVQLLQNSIPIEPSRRAFFKKSSDSGFLLLGTLYATTAIYGGTKKPVVNYISLNQNRFTHKGYRVVQISDMHIGGLIDESFVKKSVETINSLNPDIIAITGDLVDLQIEKISEALKHLALLKATYGTYFVVGNHEYFHGAQSTIEHLKKLGINVLENSNAQVGKNGDLWIVGVHDIFGFRINKLKPDILKATRNIPKDASTLLLAHQPRFIEYLGGFKPSLMLSGHTHAGQIFPFNYLVKLTQPYVKGLHPLGKNRHIYVNSGIGFWGPPMRLGSNAEITCVEWS